MRFPFFRRKKQKHIVIDLAPSSLGNENTVNCLRVGKKPKDCEVIIDIEVDINGAHKQRTVSFKNNQVFLDGIPRELRFDHYNIDPFLGIYLNQPMHLSYYNPVEEKVVYVDGCIIGICVKE